MLIPRKHKFRCSLNSLTVVSLGLVTIIPLVGYAYGKHMSLSQTYDSLIRANRKASRLLSFREKRRNALMVVADVTGQSESHIRQKYGEPQQFSRGPLKITN